MWSVVREGTMPCRPRYAVTRSAGMPWGSSSPSSPMPGQTMPNLIGSSRHQPSGRASKPCQASPGCRTQQPGSVASCSGERLVERHPRAGLAASTISSAFQGAKNHSPLAGELCRTRAMARRQATASSITSWVSASPPGPSIIAAATSFEAMSA